MHIMFRHLCSNDSTITDPNSDFLYLFRPDTLTEKFKMNYGWYHCRY